MKLVRQYNGMDCGIAVAAMVASTTWDNAALHDRNPDTNDGLTVNEFLALCASLNSPVKASKAIKGQSLGKCDLPDGTCAVLIRMAGKHRGHYVAVDGEVVLDPELGRRPLGRYGRRSWEVVRVFARVR